MTRPAWWGLRVGDRVRVRGWTFQWWWTIVGVDRRGPREFQTVRIASRLGSRRWVLAWLTDVVERRPAR